MTAADLILRILNTPGVAYLPLPKSAGSMLSLEFEQYVYEQVSREEYELAGRCLEQARQELGVRAVSSVDWPAEVYERARALATPACMAVG